MKKFLLILAIAAALWQTATAQAQDGDILWTKWTHDITRLQFSNDDSKILTVGSGGIIIFDTQTGEQLKQLPGKGIYSEDGTMIIALREMNVDVYNAETYELIKTIPLTVTGVNAVLLSPDGNLLATMGLNFIQFIDYHTGEVIHYMNKFGDEKRDVKINSIVFSRDSKQCIIALWDPVKGSYGSMMFINTITFTMSYKINERISFLRINTDGSYLAFISCDNGKAVTIMNTQSKEIVGQIPGNAWDVTSIAFSPDGKYIAIGGLNGMYGLKIYNVSDMSLFKTYFPNTSFINIAFTKDIAKIAFNAGDELVLFKFLSTGINETDVSSEFLYPNPTNNSVNISFELTLPTSLEFNLYNLTGGLMTNLKTGFYNPGLVEENLYLGELANGTYYLKIESLQFNKTYKIIINK
jgi:WD40 repeat protein